MKDFNLREYLKNNPLLNENEYTEFVDDGENQYVDFNYDKIRTIMDKFGKTEDEFDDWLSLRNQDLDPTDEEVEVWLNSSSLKEGVGEGKPLNDINLLNLIQQNQDDILSHIDIYGNTMANIEIEFDDDGDPSIVVDGSTGWSFRRLEDVDHIGPIGMYDKDDIDAGLSEPFLGQNGDKPMPINVAGTDLMYIAYNI